ncbi:hypothetical protein HY839_01110 [Candidatus Azambacteria bacterium]|nr:hypothetical protein [Candidatus Azambacteria bacterium]
MTKHRHSGLFFLHNFKEQMIAKTNFFSYPLIVFVFATVGANFSEVRVRRNSSPQPPPSAAPERVLGIAAKLRQQFRSKWVRAKFRIRDQKIEKDVTRVFRQLADPSGPTI